MNTVNLTSEQFMMIFECKRDKMNIDAFKIKIHKDDVALFAVLIDLFCAILMLVTLYRLEALNYAYKSHIGDYCVEMKDFSVVCKDV